MSLRFVNKYTVRPIDIMTGDAAAIKVVAVAGPGSGGDWAAYYGLSDWPDVRVVNEGDKIDRVAAELLFPLFQSDWKVLSGLMVWWGDMIKDNPRRKNR